MNLSLEHFEKGKKLESSKDWKRAQAEYELALENSPNSVRTLLALGNLHSRRQNWKKAKEYYFNLVSVNPSDEHYFKLGEVCAQMGQAREAIYYLKRSLEMNERYVGSHILLAGIYHNAGNLYKKESYLRNALEVDEKNFLVLQELAHLYFDTSRYRDALKILDKMESYFPAEAVNIGVFKTELLIRMGKFATAREVLEEIMENDEKVRKMVNKVLSDPIQRSRLEKKLNEKKNEFKQREIDGNRSPDISMELSILYLAVGNYHSAAKFLVYSRKTLEENSASKKPFPKLEGGFKSISQLMVQY